MERRSKINELKKEVFFRLLDIAGRVFILVKYSDAVRIGRRGFLPEEKENGIVLVFNQKMNFTWDESGIHATLLFGTTPEKCFIPPENIVAVYSPELEAQFVVSPEAEGEDREEKEESKVEDNVIRVDFRKGRQQG
jgi:hypothetical protein